VAPEDWTARGLPESILFLVIREEGQNAGYFGPPLVHARNSRIHTMTYREGLKSTISLGHDQGKGTDR